MRNGLVSFAEKGFFHLLESQLIYKFMGTCSMQMRFSIIIISFQWFGVAGNLKPVEEAGQITLFGKFQSFFALPGLTNEVRTL